MRNKGVWEHASTAAVLVLVLCSVGIAKVKSQSQKVPGLFVFGDSLVEVGNNNFLNTIARANSFPYGIDFSRGSTGRFSNGKSLIDFIDPSTIGTRILYGVNYASASALPAFLTSQGDIMTMMDASALNQFLASSIAVVVTGSNDYINNYLLPGLYGSKWSGEVRNISYSPDSKSVSVVYRVTLYGTDAEKAEAIAFRRACARFGLGLHLYHQEDAS
ncbi:hypothetical protein JHK87_032345 [Glycine soja]|nr:hypothetical protein JHK87_032345 [Glycine soja]